MDFKNTKKSATRQFNKLLIIQTQNKNRSLVADKITETGITSDGQHVTFNRSMWKWFNDETGAEVVIGAGIVWENLE